jgi:phage terminase large subunit-like protein
VGQLELDDGGLFRLEPFQRRFVQDVFSGMREAWLIVPEANGKTTLIAALALYHARFREQAYVPIAASAQDQALIMFRQAEGFVRRTDSIFNEFELRPGIREIRCTATGGLIKAKAADERTTDGIIPTLAICDELHRHKGLGLYNTWRGKLGKRLGAQIVVISTAGEPGTEFEEIREQIRQHADKWGKAFVRVRRPDLILHEYAVPEAGNVEDMRLVKAANPFSRITPATLREKFESPTMTMPHWRRFTCNLPTRSAFSAVTEREWAEIGGGEIPAGEEVWAGFDAGWRWDTTAIVPLWAPGEGARVLGPASVLTPPRNGDRLDLSAVLVALEAVHLRNPIHTLVADPTDARDVVDWARSEFGCAVVERSQGLTYQVADYEAFMQALRGGRLRHSDDPELTRHVLNAIVRMLPRGDAVFERPAQARKAEGQERRVIDALRAAAMVNAVAGETQAGSVYDQRGLLTV